MTGEQIWYSALGIAFGFGTPYMLNPDQLNWRGKTGFWFGALTLLCLLWAYFRLPECKGRSFGEIDILFANHVSARDFKKSDVANELE